LKRVAAGAPLREIALSYNVDHSTISRIEARDPATRSEEYRPEDAT
jgi:hypothetical protein